MPRASSGREATHAATRAAARALFISNEVVDSFLESASPGQEDACRAMLCIR
jgi:hypothetical protein